MRIAYGIFRVTYCVVPELAALDPELVEGRQAQGPGLRIASCSIFNATVKDDISIALGERLAPPFRRDDHRQLWFFSNSRGATYLSFPLANLLFEPFEARDSSRSLCLQKRYRE